MKKALLCIVTILGVALSASAQINFPDGSSLNTGNFSSVIPVQTLGTDIENGTALKAAMDAISVSNITPTVIQLGAGMYDLGANTLTMRPNTLIRGAGRGVTRITGSGSIVVEAGEETTLQDLQIFIATSGSALKVSGPNNYLEAFRVAIIVGIDSFSLAPESVLTSTGLEVSNQAHVDFNSSALFLEPLYGSVATGASISGGGSVDFKQCSFVCDQEDGSSNAGGSGGRKIGSLVGLNASGASSVARLFGTTLNLVENSYDAVLTGVSVGSGALVEFSGGDFKVERIDSTTAVASLSAVTGFSIGSGSDLFVKNTYVQTRLFGSDGWDGSSTLVNSGTFKAFATWFAGTVPADYVGGPYYQCTGDLGELNGETP